MVVSTFHYIPPFQSAFILKDTLRQAQTPSSWLSDSLRRTILACFDANANFNNEIRALPRLLIALAPIDYLLCLPIRYDRKCVNKLSSTVPNYGNLQCI